MMQYVERLKKRASTWMVHRMQRKLLKHLQKRYARNLKKNPQLKNFFP